MKYQDYYQTLGVDRDADTATIKKAYRKLARKFHPDVSKETDPEEKFKAVGEAYEVLKDEEKRAAYDQLGRDWQAGQDFAPPPGWQRAGSDNGYAEASFDFDSFADLFNDLYGRGGYQAAPHVNLDLHASLGLTLEELFAGQPVDLHLRDPSSGEERRLRVKVPNHLRDGESFRLKGQGRSQPGTSGTAGNLYVEIRLVPHPRFEVKGDDIYSQLEVTPWEAVLGTKIPVQTLGGKVNLAIPPRSQTGTQLRLKNRGLPGSKPGNQIVTLNVCVPTTVSDEELAHYQALADISSFDPRSS